ncbi:MAG TPA: gamma-glutamylcyclotransferase [Dongiaceae bacterium]|jgi:cation transport protein ChaC
MALTAELVARCERPEPDPGPEAGFTHFSEAEYDVLAAELLARRSPGPFWLFAYGSLIWKPDFVALEHRRATAHGWHRAFTLELTRWRGSPSQPGLMLALERGGRCNGIVYRLPDMDHLAQMGRLLRREIGAREDVQGIRWINVETEYGRVQALTFWAGVKGPGHAGKRGLREVAGTLARACGHIGSGADYLLRTVSKLDELGIRDRNLWRLQQLVADEIQRGVP